MQRCNPCSTQLFFFFPLALHQLTAVDSIRITPLFKCIYLIHVAKWLRSEGKSSLLLVFKYEQNFSMHLLQPFLNTQMLKYFWAVKQRMLLSADGKSDQKPCHPHSTTPRQLLCAGASCDNTTVTRAARWPQIISSSSWSGHSQGHHLTWCWFHSLRASLIAQGNVALSQASRFSST